MSLFQKIITGYIIAVNFIAYIVMCYDKFQSKHKGSRVSEAGLWLLALVLGASGIYVGMQIPLYHKASKHKFKYGIPLCIILNLFVVYCLLYARK